jgi:formate dehydrogenase subunit delta
MSREKLVRMANQIAEFMETGADGDKAEAVADHINQFWAPDMRRDLIDMLAESTEGVQPLVVEALPRVRPPKQPA